MGISPPPMPDSDDYSAEATLIPFQSPLPLLRGPVRAGPSDDPSAGPYLLAFRNPRAWAAAFVNCKAQIMSQCESGARIGCSISASSKCKPSWWKTILGMSTKQDLKDRARCEEIEMEACLAAAKERCRAFAKEKSEPAFENARIRVSSSVESKTVDWKEVFRLISSVCYAERKFSVVGVRGINKSWDEFRRQYEVTNVRGSDLLGSDNMNIEDYLKDCN